MSVCLVPSYLVLSLLGRCLCAQDESFHSAVDVLRRVRVARQDLRSGDYEITARHAVSMTSLDGSEIYVEEQESWSGKCRFDLAKQVAVMHYRQTGDLTHSTSKTPNETPFVCMLDQDGYWIYDGLASGSAFFLFPDYQSSPKEGLRKSPLLPHTLGLVGVSRAIKGATLQTAMDQIVIEASHDVTGPTIVPDPDDPNRLIVRQVYQKGRIRKQTFVDRSQDWAAVKLLVEHGDYEPSLDEFTAQRVSFQIDTQWKEIDGVFVPVRSAESRFLPRYSVREGVGADVIDMEVTSRELELEWLNVNPKLGDEAWDYHQFDLPRGTDVVDVRGESPQVIDRIEGEMIASVPPEAGSSFPVRLIIAIGVGAVLFFAYVFLSKGNPESG